jgi:hypothetical protein
MFRAIAWMLLGATMLDAQQARPSDYQVKAVYLYNFGKFVSWPAAVSGSESFPICVIGQDPFGNVLDATLSGETIGGKAVVVRRLSRLPEVAACRVLFISSSEAGRLREIFAAINKAGVLTVSDIPGFSQRGGMIQFVLQGSKVRFEVDLKAAEDAGLTVSSELLKVAINVRRGPQPGD